MEYFDQVAEFYEENSRIWPWSWLRRRETVSFLDLAGNVSDAKVMDLGAGAGFYSRLMLRQGARHVTAVDASPIMIKALGISEQIKGVASRAEDLNLTDRFQFIVCAGLLEFVDDPQRVFSVARQHADQKCSMVVLVPCDNVWGKLYRLFHKSHGVNVYLFRAECIKTLAEKVGWIAGEERWIWPFSYQLHLVARR